MSNRRLWLWLCGSCWLLLLSGCARQSGQQLENVPLPAQWQQHQQASAAAIAQPDWWRLFASDELNALVQRARQNNRDLQAASARLAQAEAQLNLAGASLFPSLALSGSGQRSGTVGGDGASSYGLNGNASYELDLWGRLRGNRAGAEAALAASGFARDSLELTVLASVVSSYLQVRYLADNLALARENLALAEQLLALVESKVRYGAVSPQDLAQQTTVVANQRARLPMLEQQLRQTRYALAVLVGELPQALQLEGGELAVLNLPQPQAGLPDQVLGQRPDVAQALAQLMAADARVAVARSDYFPAITLTGSAGYRSDALATLLSGDALYNLAASLGQNLFDGGARRARLAQARAAWEEQQASYQGVLLNALQEVDQSLGQLQALAGQQPHRQLALEQAELAYRLAEVRYREGATELSDVLSAQNALNNARQTMLDYQLERYQSRVTLFRVLGVAAAD